MSHKKDWIVGIVNSVNNTILDVQLGKILRRKHRNSRDRFEKLQVFQSLLSNLNKYSLAFEMHLWATWNNGNNVSDPRRRSRILNSSTTATSIDKNESSWAKNFMVSNTRSQDKIPVSKNANISETSCTRDITFIREYSFGFVSIDCIAFQFSSS